MEEHPASKGIQVKPEVELHLRSIVIREANQKRRLRDGQAGANESTLEEILEAVLRSQVYKRLQRAPPSGRDDKWFPLAREHSVAARTLFRLLMEPNEQIPAIQLHVCQLCHRIMTDDNYTHNTETAEFVGKLPYREVMQTMANSQPHLVQTVSGRQLTPKEALAKMHSNTPIGRAAGLQLLSNLASQVHLYRDDDQVQALEEAFGIVRDAREIKSRRGTDAKSPAALGIQRVIDGMKPDERAVVLKPITDGQDRLRRMKERAKSME